MKISTYAGCLCRQGYFRVVLRDILVDLINFTGCNGVRANDWCDTGHLPCDSANPLKSTDNALLHPLKLGKIHYVDKLNNHVNNKHCIGLLLMLFSQQHFSQSLENWFSKDLHNQN